jgi:hypothetical protein
MNGLPLHPAIVHIPLGVAIVMPVVGSLVALAVWRGWVTRRAWTIAVVLQAVVLGGALLALRSGEADEDRAEAWASEAAIEAHEEAAEVFTLAAGLTLALSVLPLALRGRAGQAAGGFATAAMAIVLVLGLRVGHAGGTIVYGAGAGAAPAAAGAIPAGAAAGADAARAGGHDEDDD